MYPKFCPLVQDMGKQQLNVVHHAFLAECCGGLGSHQSNVGVIAANRVDEYRLVAIDYNCKGLNVYVQIEPKECVEGFVNEIQPVARGHGDGDWQ
mmetsp:Transcript_20651/g.46700  ORF Transcript_20651/g.46700 Transcript_20651/m.46700 type:complete len:95 (-) Transcript_20651:376-660(-)